ncbi:hypothetical protein CXB51_037004 [Gossypium anomalum]|uniref:DUF4283 domain-containing protein n=1 Tax=Gossypium anomalum TaxID=47600 RepID=A0A8J6CIB6_9ROSI|nr:hypothetical protein CXB51_037004 [Gossypium anomalum]
MARQTCRAIYMEDGGLEDEVVVESKLQIGEDNYMISTKGKFPEITFSKRIHEWIDGAWLRQLQCISRKKILAIKLCNQKDYDKAFMGGPWMIYRHYLVVQPWS